MLFLNPTILLGLFAAAIPLIIHMLNLRKLKIIDFSTLKFLKELQKSKIRKIKFKQWLLLALRVLIILFIVFAFARPTLKEIALSGTTSSAKTSAVFILDDSFSMSFVESQGSLFNQAKSEINKILTLLKEGDDSEIILTSASNFDNYKLSKNLSFIKKKIKGLNFSLITSKLNDAIKKGFELLSSSNNFNKELYVFSDFQKINLPDNYSKNKNTFDDIKLYSIKLGGENYKNIGIDKLTLGTQILEINKPIKFNATLTNYSSEKISNIVLSLFINGERKNQKNISLNPGTSINQELNTEVSTSGFISAFVEIDDDELLPDNKRFINLYIPEKINIGIIADKSSDRQFIITALTSGRNKDIIKITEVDTKQSASYNLSNFDVIILIPSKTFTNESRLKKYIESGGGLILFPGSNISDVSFQQILSFLNLSAEVKYSGIKNTNKNYFSFEKVDFEHPLFENLFSKKKKEEIDSPRILYHFIYKFLSPLRKIIKLNDGSVFLSEIKKDKGKIFLFNIAPVLSWSNFPVKGLFAPLINKSVFYLSAESVSNKEYLMGSKIKINLKELKNGIGQIEKPDKSTEFINIEDSKNNNYISFSNTYQAGVYKILSNNKTQTLFSVNNNPRESVQDYLTQNEFEDYLKKINFKGKYISIDKSAELLSVIKQARFGSVALENFYYHCFGFSSC